MYLKVKVAFSLVSDVNECVEQPSVCFNGVCENTLGSFLCSCNEGFKLDANGRDCQGMYHNSSFKQCRPTLVSALMNRFRSRKDVHVADCTALSLICIIILLHISLVGSGASRGKAFFICPMCRKLCSCAIMEMYIMFFISHASIGQCGV